MRINQFLETMATDLKLQNILCGLMPHASVHPCAYCKAKSDMLTQLGQMRSVSGCHTNYKKWIDSGGQKKKAKNSRNCIHPPIMGTENDESLILQYLPPPELHMFLGGTNTIYDHMLSEHQTISEQ